MFKPEDRLFEGGQSYGEFMAAEQAADTAHYAYDHRGRRLHAGRRTVESIRNAGSRIANSGYGHAAMYGAAAGGVLLGGGINLAAGEVGHPAENLPVMDGPQVLKGMVAGAALGVAGKFINDTRKMSNERTMD